MSVESDLFAAATKAPPLAPPRAPSLASLSNDDPRMGDIIHTMTLSYLPKHLEQRRKAWEQQHQQQQAAGSTTRRQMPPAIVLSGFPFDEGCRRNGGRVGAEEGPTAMRKLLSRMGTAVNPEYQIDMTKLDIVDVGDVDRAPGSGPLEKAHDALHERVSFILRSGPNVVPFIIGGSNDQSFPNAMGLMDVLGHGRIGVINIDAHLDVRPLKNNQVHSGSPFRLLLEEKRFAAHITAIRQRKKSGDADKQKDGDDAENDNEKDAAQRYAFCEFAAQGSQCSAAHADFVTKTHGQQIQWLNQIRLQQQSSTTHTATSPSSTPSTSSSPSSSSSSSSSAPLPSMWQPTSPIARQFRDTLHSLCGEHLFVSFDLDSVRGSDAPGVSCPGSDGLTAEDALQMMFQAGRNPRVRLVDLSEFNPHVEEYRTGKLVANMFYYFCMGVAVRNKTSGMQMA